MVVDQGDIDGLKNAVLRLSNGKFTMACRQKALAEFDNFKCFNLYITLYNKLIER